MQCLSGTRAAPNNGANCGSGGQGWGWNVEACTSQATCSAANGQGCSECYLQQPFAGSCGYCASTGRCELVGASDSAPLDNDCGDNSQWYPNADTCVTPVPASDPCGSNPTCLQCENAPPEQKCGWCGVTGQCLTGGPNGPTAQQPGCNNGATWSFQSCPSSDSVCATAAACTDCQTFENCVWCKHSNKCLPGIDGPIPSAGTCSSVVTSWQTCPAAPPGPTPPGPTPPPGGDPPSFPAVGVWAIVALVGVGTVSVGAVLFYLCARSFDVPVLGSRIALARAGSLRDYTSGFLRLVPLLFFSASLALKLASFGLDQWDTTYIASSDFEYSIAFKIFYGLFHARIMATGSAADQGQIPNQTIDYKDGCVAYATGEGENTDLCRALRASGIIVLVLGVGSAVASFAIGALSAVAIARRDSTSFSPSRLLVPMWRASGVAYISSCAAFLCWVLAGHWIVHHPDGKAELGASTFLMLVAAIIDLAAVWFTRQAVTATPDPDGSGETLSGATEPYRVMRDFAHEGGGGGGHQAHSRGAVPEGYGVPADYSAGAVDYRPPGRRSF